MGRARLPCAFCSEVRGSVAADPMGGGVKRGALSLAAPSLGFQTTREPLLLAAWLLDPFPPPPPQWLFQGPFQPPRLRGAPPSPGRQFYTQESPVTLEPHNAAPKAGCLLLEAIPHPLEP